MVLPFIYISMDRPFYSTEADYYVSLEDEECERLENAADWDDVPDIYDKVYDEILSMIKDELVDLGTVDDDADVEACYSIDVAFPCDDEDEEDEDEDGEDEETEETER